MYGIVYKITNIINNKVYIGVTTRRFVDRYCSKGTGIERVFGYHQARKDCGNCYNKHLHSSIKKYGFESFVVKEVFDIAKNKEELAQKEKYYIDFYDSLENGYNATGGGELISKNLLSKSRTKIIELNSERIFNSISDVCDYFHEVFKISSLEFIIRNTNGVWVRLDEIIKVLSIYKEGDEIYFDCKGFLTKKCNQYNKANIYKCEECGKLFIRTKDREKCFDCNGQPFRSAMH